MRLLALAMLRTATETPAEAALAQVAQSLEGLDPPAFAELSPVLLEHLARIERKQDALAEALAELATPWHVRLKRWVRQAVRF